MEAADRGVVLVGQAALEAVVEVLDPVRGLDPHAIRRQAHDLAVGQVELVVDLADDLLEQVLERHQSLDVAVLVDDEREAPAVALELRQLLRQRRSFL